MKLEKGKKFIIRNEKELAKAERFVESMYMDGARISLCGSRLYKVVKAIEKYNSRNQ